MDGIAGFCHKPSFLATRAFWSHAGSILWPFSSSL